MHAVDMNPASQASTQLLLCCAYMLHLLGVAFHNGNIDYGISTVHILEYNT